MLAEYKSSFNKVNLLHLIDDIDIGGTERGLLNLVSSLDWNKYNSLVCSFEKGPLASAFETQGIEPIIMEKRYSCDLILLFKLLRLIQEKRIHLIHCRLLFATIYGGICASLLRIPFVVSIHGKSIFELKRGITSLRMAERYARKIIAVSKSLKDELTEIFGLKPEKITVIHNGVDFNKYSNCVSAVSKTKLGIKSSDYVIGSVGTLRSVKGYEYLLLSVPKVLQIFPNTKFVIAGDGPLKEELQKLACELNIQHDVIFLGYRKDIPDVLSAFDIFVLPSLTEGSPNALLEAMASSKPVIATKVGGIPEIILDGTTGVLVPSKNSAKLSVAILDLLEDENKRIAMGNAGFERVKEHFSPEATARKYEQVYEEALYAKENPPLNPSLSLYL